MSYQNDQQQHKLKQSDRTDLKFNYSFFIYFNLAILLISLTQLLLYPLSFLHRSTYNRSIKWTKSNFTKVLIIITQSYAPTSFNVTLGRGPNGSLEWLQFIKDPQGNIIEIIGLPEKGIWISNHQSLVDWIYLWSFAYFVKLDDHIIITLKSSIKLIPFIGWVSLTFFPSNSFQMKY